jgi:hypothetical protein
MLVSQRLRKIAIVKASRPRDGSAEQIAAAHERKMRTNATLLEALQVYLDEWWRVEILPWVVGVSGLLDNDTIKSCLEVLEIQRQCWRGITEDTARESVKNFYSLHRVRCRAVTMGPQSSGLRAACYNSKTGFFSRNTGFLSKLFFLV